MTMLEILEEARRSTNPIYHDFLLTYKDSDRSVYGIVEGKDDPNFYRSLIDSKLPPNWKIQLVIANSKQRVLDTFKIMDWKRFAASRICFFVDRDLSTFIDPDPSSASNLYVTDYYSIESYVVNYTTFEVVLEDVFGITDLLPQHREVIRAAFADNLSRFALFMLPVMAQVISWRRAGQKVMLDNIDPGQFLSFSLGKLTIPPDFRNRQAVLQKICANCGLPLSTDEELAVIEAELREETDPRSFIRGKYLLWLFVKMAEDFHRSIDVYCERYASPPKVRITVGLRNAMTVIGPRVRVPTSLDDFISRNYLRFVSEFESRQTATETE